MDLRHLLEALGRAGQGEALRHLLACGRCRSRAVLPEADVDLDDTRSDLPAEMPPPPPAASAIELRLSGLAMAAMQRNLSAAFADRENAESLFRELLARPSEERFRAVAGDETFASPGLAHSLLDRAEALCPESPGEASHLAALALLIANRLPPPWTMLERESLAGRARCLEGEAKRRMGEIPAARVALRQSFRHFEALPVGCAERADFCRYLARLRRDQGRDDEALALMARAIERFDSLPERRRAAECRLELAWMHLDDLDSSEALRHFEEVRAQEAEGFGKTPFEVWLSVRHGLALCHADLRREAAARAVLAEIASLAQRRPRLDRLRASRAEADVAQRLEANDEAEALLAASWVGFLEEGAPYDAVLALLELAQLYAEQGRTSEIERLHRELSTVDGLGAPAHEALRFGLDFALLHGLAGIEMLEALKVFVQRARHNPEARFSVTRRPTNEVPWKEAEGDLRVKLAAWAGLPESTGRLAETEIPPADRRRLVWVAEAILGMRVVFGSGGEPDPAAEEAVH
jgi:hypothetical protein